MSEAIINSLPYPALLLGADERIYAANAGARQIFGDGILGRHHIAIIRQPQLLDAVETVRKTKEPGTARYLTTIARRDMTWLAHIAAVGDTDEILISFEDQTAVEDAEKQRRDFVANVSHELKTPLTALLGFIETLRGAARDDPKAQERFLTIMEREGLRMNRLVQDLLSLNRVESEERVRPSDTVELVGLSHSVINALSPLAAENDVKISGPDQSTKTDVVGDSDQLSQVITNLLENAIKYSGKGSEVFFALESVERHPMVRGPAVILTIRDTGEGIDPLHLPRLAERFYRIDSHRSREMGGTGLGLAIVKHIVNRHRGRLRFESEMGEGTTVSVILPAFLPE
ncbi:MAG: ATP-binding protein [Boseongicola sp.]|nr:ATP-binding protein [Boseongicola sp.]